MVNWQSLTLYFLIQSGIQIKNKLLLYYFTPSDMFLHAAPMELAKMMASLLLIYRSYGACKDDGIFATDVSLLWSYKILNP